MRGRAAAVTGAVALAALVLPTGLSVLGAHRDAVRIVERQATLYSEDAMHRSTATAAQGCAPA